MAMANPANSIKFKSIANTCISVMVTAYKLHDSLIDVSQFGYKATCISVTPKK